jgi:hypothetical protein
LELHYLDIRPQGERTKDSGDGTQSQGRRSEADAIPVADVSSRALRVLHGAFTQWRIESGIQPYALALPGGLETLRVFCASRDTLDALADRTEQHPFMRDYMIYGRIRRAYITEETRWVEYRRYRIPNRNAIAVGEHEKENLTRRGSRVKHALRLPHFVVLSKSTGQRARIYVEQQDWMQDIPKALTPDSWGLSRLSARFAVPVV